MRDKESPDLTTYTSDEPVDGLLDPLLELPEELELELLDEDPFLLTTNTFPGKISVVSRLFHFIKLLREMLCFEAIPLSVSPLLTVYVEFELVDGLVVFELLLEFELDDCSLSVSMIWFGKIRSPEIPLMERNCEMLVLYCCAIDHNESPL
ncbi:hypothetical protein [Virgibacillus halodenitrificans]|uniref:hypothetical protein n=1 Tax=Virgibacillus halodenitrificans TaxID=1482 RepID=UPI003F618B80